MSEQLTCQRCALPYTLGCLQGWNRLYCSSECAFAVPLRERIEALAIGECLQLVDGSVKRHSRYDYVLNDDSNKERNRWGTLEQITADAEFFLANGALPPADMPRW